MECAYACLSHIWNVLKVQRKEQQTAGLPKAVSGPGENVFWGPPVAHCALSVRLEKPACLRGQAQPVGDWGTTQGKGGRVDE